MKKRYLCASAVLAVSMVCGPAGPAAAVSGEPVPLLITEVQPGSAASASQEFIELFNVSNAPVDLTAGRWRLEIASSTATTWNAPFRTVELSGSVAPGQTYVVASKYTGNNQLTQYLLDIAKASFSSGISASAGHVRLVYTIKAPAAGGACTDSARVIDEVEWSGLKLGQPATPSLDGRSMFVTVTGGVDAAMSLQRLINSEDRIYADTDNDSLDFAVAAPTPGAAHKVTYNAAAPPADTCSVTPDPPADPPEPPSPPADTGSGGDGAPADGQSGAGDPPAGDGGSVPNPAVNAGLLAPYISELLPNPAAPQTDSADEFIELYNPNDAAFDASGYVLEVGEITKHRYTLPAGTLLAPHAWTPLFSAATALSLANNGGRARLIDLTGVVIMATDAYAAAPAGQAWAQIDGIWQWTTTPTPAAANTVTALPAVIKKTAAAAVSAKKTAAVKAAAAPKTPKSSTAKAPKTIKTTQPAATAFTPVAATTRNPLHTGVLAAVAVFAILYGAYEYRGDIANKFHQLRHNRAVRRSNRQSPPRR